MNDSSNTLLLLGILRDLGMDAIYPNSRVDTYKMQDMAASTIRITLEAQPVQIAIRVSDYELLARGKNFAHESLAETVKSQIASVIMPRIENSNYFRSKQLTIQQKDDKIKLLEERVKVLEYQLDSEKEHEPI